MLQLLLLPCDTKRMMERMNPNNNETKFYLVRDGAETFTAIASLPDENCLPPGILSFNNEEKAWEALEANTETDFKIVSLNVYRLREKLRAEENELFKLERRLHKIRLAKSDFKNKKL